MPIGNCLSLLSKIPGSILKSLMLFVLHRNKIFFLLKHHPIWYFNQNRFFLLLFIFSRPFQAPRVNVVFLLTNVLLHSRSLFLDDADDDLVKEW